MNSKRSCCFIMLVPFLLGCTLDPKLYGANGRGSIGKDGWGGGLIGGRFATFGETPKTVKPVAPASASASKLVRE